MGITAVIKGQTDSGGRDIGPSAPLPRRPKRPGASPETPPSILPTEDKQAPGKGRHQALPRWG